MGAGTSNSFSCLASNELLKRFVGADVITYNDPYWNTLLSFASKVPRTSGDSRLLDESIQPLFLELADNCLATGNLATLVTVFLTRAKELHESARCDNSVFVWQAHNALFIVRVVSKLLLEHFTELQALQLLESTGAAPDTHPTTLVQQLLGSITSVLVTLPIVPATYALHLEAVTTLSVLLSGHVCVSTANAGPQYIVFGLLQQACRQLQGGQMVEALLQHIIQRPPPPPDPDYTYSFVAGLAAGLWSVLTLGLAAGRDTSVPGGGAAITDDKTATHPVPLKPVPPSPLADQSVLLLLVLVTHTVDIDTQVNDFRTALYEAKNGTRDHGSASITITGNSSNNNHQLESTTILIEDSNTSGSNHTQTILSNNITAAITSSTNSYTVSNSTDYLTNITAPSLKDTASNNTSIVPAVNNSTVLTGDGTVETMNGTACPTNGTVDSTGNSAASSSSITVSYPALHAALTLTLHTEHTTLLLYLVMHHNEAFRSYLLSGSEMEVVVLPLLQTLHCAASLSSHHVYMALIVLLMLSEDAAFNATLHHIPVPIVPWYCERPLHNLSLGDLLILVLIRTITFNMTKMRDRYLHSNCLAALANMSSQWRQVHPRVCHRVIALLETLAKRHARVKGAIRGGGDGGEGGEELLSDLGAIEEVLRMVLEILNSTLTHQLCHNPQLLYTLLYKRHVFLPFSTQPNFSDVCMNIDMVLNYLMNRLEKTTTDPSVADVQEVIEQGVLQLPKERLRKFPELKFKYVEESSPEEFFIPYVWTLVYQSSGLYWRMENVALFDPAGQES